MSISLKRLASHLQQDGKSLRKMLGRPAGPVKLEVRQAPFSVMTHNMALLVPPAPYLGTDRDGAIAEIVARIRALAPDVVGLCEVFANGERKRIRDALSDLYPHFREGPDEGDLESDGGLLLLSRHPLLAADAMIFRACDGWDCFANKGVIHIRVQPASWPIPLDIFYSHMQNIETDNGVGTLYAQLTTMNNFIVTRRDPAGSQIIMGDLNIPGENQQHYAQLYDRLRLVDCWFLADNQATSGPTLVIENNFYANPDDRPSSNHRLDYVLMRGGIRLVPILADIEVLKFQHNGRFISDHFGVRASFDKIAIITF
ncbi:Endonuclease/exonuclease/phosphatase [Paenibacillus curdlanolyticus YK9]|uniref:Endonuclease/exonuclease/phosphatase n=1 Tax=Paenibacillus curdlanolyticus YK9 TaxID=717606 RepID=E0I5Q8_9BACL|nr:endonuclease/exonuclease/phosphatase family protein [Paenibacillus curdlanolyticus]EFM12300.1 Endonuclease/exonuclease/phosphatase [Paenibacillus curdlanolyticus YK9]